MQSPFQYQLKYKNGHAIHFECIALIIIFAYFKKLLKFLLSSFFCIMLLWCAGSVLNN